MMALKNLEAFEEESHSGRFSSIGICLSCMFYGIVVGFVDEHINMLLEHINPMYTSLDWILFSSCETWVFIGSTVGCLVSALSMCYIGRRGTLLKIASPCLGLLMALVYLTQKLNQSQMFYQYVIASVLITQGLHTTLHMSVIPIYLLDTVCKTPGSYESHAAAILIGFTQLPYEVGAFLFTLFTLLGLPNVSFYLPIPLLLIAFVWYLRLPESPRWLMIAKRDVEEAKNALRSFRQGKSRHYDVNRELTLLKKDLDDATSEESLFRPLTISCVIMLLLNLAGYEVYRFYTPWALRNAGIFVDPSILFNIVYVCSVAFATSVLTVFPGPKCLNLFLLVFTCILMFCLCFTGVWFYVLEQGNEFAMGIVPVLAFGVYLLSFQCGLGAFGVTVSCLITQGKYRSIVLPASLMVYHLALYSNQRLLIPMINELHPFGVFWLYAVLTGVTLIFVAVVVLPEIKRVAKLLTGEETAQFLPLKRIVGQNMVT